MLIESLTRRLAECPPEFLAEPRIGVAGVVVIAAVVSDTLVALGGAPLTPTQARVFESTDARRDRNRLRLVLITCWLFQAADFAGKNFAARAHFFLEHELAQLAELLPSERVITDPERREELARLCLHALGLVPHGETTTQAHDRLATLNTAERQRVIRAAQEAEARARHIREEMEAARRREQLEADLKASRE